MVRLRKVPASFQSTSMDGELIMIHAGTGQFFALKDVGLEVWNALDSQPDLDRICDDLQAGYDVSTEDCRKSVKGFADRLVAAGFVEPF